VPVRDWRDLTLEDVRALDRERVVAVLPIAAIEQHGPHLPLATDAVIAEGFLAETARRVPEDLDVLVLPVQQIGKSDEHLSFPGTLTLSAETLIRAWVEIGESVARAGIRRLVIVSSHGGNSEVMGIVARELRLRRAMLAVATAWHRFGRPEGLFDAEEVRHGIHGGDVETSLMLHFRPDLVRRDHAGDFAPASVEMARDFAWLRATGPAPFAWMTEDLHPSGACGNAGLATAEKGRRLAEHIAAEFVRLLQDVGRFDLGRLGPARSL